MNPGCLGIPIKRGLYAFHGQMISNKKYLLIFVVDIMQFLFYFYFILLCWQQECKTNIFIPSTEATCQLQS